MQHLESIFQDKRSNTDSDTDKYKTLFPQIYYFPNIYSWDKDVSYILKTKKC